uniref:Uncharacterized protein n=1 Tax=Thermus islandicus TaxID=540988 RepID=A0A831UAC6_9DEIN
MEVRPGEYLRFFLGGEVMKEGVFRKIGKRLFVNDYRPVWYAPKEDPNVLDFPAFTLPAEVNLEEWYRDKGPCWKPSGDPCDIEEATPPFFKADLWDRSPFLAPNTQLILLVLPVVYPSGQEACFFRIFAVSDKDLSEVLPHLEAWLFEIDAGIAPTLGELL